MKMPTRYNPPPTNHIQNYPYGTVLPVENMLHTLPGINNKRAAFENHPIGVYLAARESARVVCYTLCTDMHHDEECRSSPVPKVSC